MKIVLRIKRERSHGNDFNVSDTIILNNRNSFYAFVRQEKSLFSLGKTVIECYTLERIGNIPSLADPFSLKTSIVVRKIRIFTFINAED
ncbi:hypothetical protein NPIL_152571 [Nephila pilipes]|uniref:Uncharacterized protein n=1 Tax=Nephila pilipes TaxID=299642 RepID=A0A8X6TW23_NEPPI|nr:hypothetical protein NPIL_152571 [Nephila pilipes]